MIIYEWKIIYFIVLMIYDLLKMGFNFELVRIEDEKMIMLIIVKILEVFFFNKRYRNIWKKILIFNN